MSTAKKKLLLCCTIGFSDGSTHPKSTILKAKEVIIFIRETEVKKEGSKNEVEYIFIID